MFLTEATCILSSPDEILTFISASAALSGSRAVWVPKSVKKFELSFLVQVGKFVDFLNFYCALSFFAIAFLI